MRKPILKRFTRFGLSKFFIDRKGRLRGRKSMYSIPSDYKRFYKFIGFSRPLTPYFGYKNKDLKLKRSSKLRFINQGRLLFQGNRRLFSGR